MHEMEDLLFETDITHVQRDDGTQSHTSLPEDSKDRVFERGVVEFCEIIQYLLCSVAVEHLGPATLLSWDVRAHHFLIQVFGHRFDQPSPLQEHSQATHLGSERHRGEVAAFLAPHPELVQVPPSEFVQVVAPSFSH